MPTVTAVASVNGSHAAAERTPNGSLAGDVQGRPKYETAET